MALNKSPETRWAWVEIDQGALRHNTRTLRSLLEPGVQMMCAVKADAYGHGAVACARVMAQAGANQFAVATVAEGAELREAGITQPILILSEPPVESIPYLLASRLMPSIMTEEFALAFGEAAAASGVPGRYHLAIDTGMNRFGVPYADALELRRAIDFHRGLSCEGCFTHFATADKLDDWDLALQAKHFMEALTSLHEAGFDCGLVHCDNTPGTILHPDLHLDMCRVGIGLYGLHAAPTTAERLELEPVMSVRARVTRVTSPAVGEGVSYGMTYRVPTKGTQIATIPLGYADGYSRVLSNRAEVLVDGRRYAQVGAICMDQCMFAIEPADARAAAAPALVAGDVVTVMGVDGDDAITADELAELIGTINYEITCHFGMRLEKLYV